MPRPSKYHAIGVRDETGAFFASKAELARYRQLQLLQRVGEISDLRRQVPIVLRTQSGFPLTKLVIDFAYSERGRQIYEDVKGGGLLEVARLKLNHLVADNPTAEVRIWRHGKPIEVVRVSEKKRSAA